MQKTPACPEKISSDQNARAVSWLCKKQYNSVKSKPSIINFLIFDFLFILFAKKSEHAFDTSTRGKCQMHEELRLET